MFNTDQVIEEQLPKIKNNKLLFKPVRSILKFLLHEKECQSFAEQYPHLEGIDFVEQVLDYFDFSYSVLDKEKITYSVIRSSRDNC